MSTSLPCSDFLALLRFGLLIKSLETETITGGADEHAHLPAVDRQEAANSGLLGPIQS